MNHYATIDAVKAVMNTSGTALDERLFTHLETASRAIDTHCGRVFWTEIASRYFKGRCGRRIYVDDFLALMGVGVDSELDNTFDGETWVEDTDYTTWPDNTWPKIGLSALPSGSYAWTDHERYIKLTGTWGYGNGKDGTPWKETAITATVADASSETITLSADGTVKVGHTLLIGDEQVFVTAIGTGTATATRGVNKTTAAAHTTAAVGLASYPEAITNTAITVAIGILGRVDKGVMKTERLGDYSYTLQTAQEEQAFMGRALLGFERPIV
jgi:hypothetical protein